MNSKFIVIVALIISGASCVSFGHAEEPVSVYKKPDRIPGLPKRIVSELMKLGCLIPQGVYNHSNVLKGEFAAKGQKDWAVLCTINDRSHIHIFWGGEIKCSSQISERRETDYLNKAEKNDREYYRGLGKVGRKFIMDHYEAYGGPEPPPITHDAIDDRYLEKASEVHYCDNGKWVDLTGAD